MNNIMTIVKKEFLDIMRDRKTLAMTFLIPIIIMPLLFSFIFSSIGNSAPSEDNHYQIALNTDSDGIYEMFNNIETIDIVESDHPKDDAINGDLVMYIESFQFEETLYNNQTPEIDLYYDASSQKAMTAVEIIQSCFQQYQNQLASSLLQSNNLPSSLLAPLTFNSHGQNDNDSISTMLLGMLVPMMVIGYCGTGMQQIATDLGAGEKERGTLEPLLSTGVSRSSILIGKLIVIAVFGIVTSVLSAIGIFAAMQFGMQSLEISMNIKPSGIIIILILAILYAIFLSAIMLLVSTYSRSTKEAGTYLTPVILIPMLLSIVTAYGDSSSVSLLAMNIPIYNVITCIKEVAIGQINMTHIYLTIGWSIIYMIIAIVLTYYMYNREDVIFRT